MASLPTTDPHIKVLVADSVTMSCRLLADALQRSNRFHASAAVNGKELSSAMANGRPDVVLLSANFADEAQNGFVVLRQLHKNASGVATVVLLDDMQRNVVVAAFRSGARGVFCRSHSFESLCKCIECVHRGQVWANAAQLRFVADALAMPPLVQNRDFPSSRPLSNREAEIAHLVAEGLSNRQISQRLQLSEHTIKNYLFRVFEKLGVQTRVELALYALDRRPLKFAPRYSTTRS